MRDAFTDEELADYAKAQGPADGHGPLTRTDLVLFDVIDALKWIEYGLYRSQGGKPRHPQPTPRPGLVDPKKKKTGAVAALNPAGLAHLQSLRATRGD